MLQDGGWVVEFCMDVEGFVVWLTKRDDPVGRSNVTSRKSV